MALARFLALASSLSCPPFSAPMAERIGVLTNARSVVYKGCSFSDLTFEGNGGAICIARESKSPSTASLAVSSCCFERCSAHAGGAIFFDGYDFLSVSSVGTRCVAQDGGALASAWAANLAVNLTSAVQTDGGSVDLSGSVQVVINHNTSRCYHGGVVIRKHDSLDLSFAELTAINLGKCLTLHSNAAPETIKCVAVCDSVVGAILYVAGVYTVRDATFRNNAPDVFVVFGPSGALTLMGCAMDVRTVSSAQEDAEVHRLVVEDAAPDRGHRSAAPQIPGLALLLGGSDDSSVDDLSFTLKPFSVTEEPYSEVHFPSQELMESLLSYVRSKELSVSGTNTETEKITISEDVTASSSLRTTLLPRRSESDTLSGALTISDVSYTKVIILSSELQASNELSWSRTYTESQDGSGSDTIKFSQPVELLVTENLTASRLASTHKIGSSGQLSLSDDATFSEPITESNVFPISRTLADTRMVVTQSFRVSAPGTVSGGLKPSAERFSGPLNETKALALSDWFSESLGLNISVVVDETEIIIISEEFSLSQLVSSQIRLTAVHVESADASLSDRYTLSNEETTSGVAAVSVGLSLSGAQVKSVNLSASVRPVVSQIVGVTRLYDESDLAAHSVGFPLSDKLMESDAQTLSNRAPLSRWLTLSGDLPDSGEGTYSDVLVPSAWGTRSNNVTFSGVPMLSIVVNATKEAWHSEALPLTKRLQETIVRGVSDMFTGSLTLTPSEAPNEGLSNTIVILLSVLGSLLFLVIIGLLLWFFVLRRKSTSVSSTDQGSSTEEGSSDSSDIPLQGINAFGAQPDPAPRASPTQQSPGARQPATAPDSHGNESHRGAAQPPQDYGSESGSSYYSDSSSAPADAVKAKSAVADSPPDPPVKPQLPPGDHSHSSDSGPANPPPPPPPGKARPPHAPAEEDSEYTYIDSEEPAPAAQSSSSSSGSSGYSYSEASKDD